MKFLFMIALCGLFVTGHAQSSSLPIKVLTSNDATKPIVFFATGDGGWTKFSTGFMESLNKAGYPVIALNSKDYFWHKKTPSQTASDIGHLLKGYLSSWKRDSLVLIGYSFGADVTPFIQNYMDRSIAARTRHIVLMIPYSSTDFEVHLTEMIGIGSKDDYSVPDEINKISIPILFVMGTGKSQFPINLLRIHNFRAVSIDGGHHFDDNADKVAQHALSFLK